MEDHALHQRITKEIMYELIDEVTLSLCFEVHRSAKMGTIFLSETDPESERTHQIVDTVGKDVFGQVSVSNEMRLLSHNDKVVAFRSRISVVSFNLSLAVWSHTHAHSNNYRLP